jgi:ribonuclease HII
LIQLRFTEAQLQLTGGNVPHTKRVAQKSASSSPNLWHYENLCTTRGFNCIAGVDEAGRGPLAGPVVAAAAILTQPLHESLVGLNDSKQLTEKQRDFFFRALVEELRVPHGVGIVSVETIDRINILQATHLAMQQALDALPVRPDHALVDGRPVPSLTVPHTAIVDGDALSYSIAAASVIAKVTRDRLMRELHQQFPQYNFAQHKGYGTKEHIALILQHGACPAHRKTFKIAATSV